MSTRKIMIAKKNGTKAKVKITKDLRLNCCTCGAPEAEPGDILEYEHAEDCPMGQ
jgi:DNA-binding Xre family transcriptional regulator